MGRIKAFLNKNGLIKWILVIMGLLVASYAFGTLVNSLFLKGVSLDIAKSIEIFSRIFFFGVGIVGEGIIIHRDKKAERNENKKAEKLLNDITDGTEKLRDLNNPGKEITYTELSAKVATQEVELNNCKSAGTSAQEAIYTTLNTQEYVTKYYEKKTTVTINKDRATALWMKMKNGTITDDEKTELEKLSIESFDGQVDAIENIHNMANNIRTAAKGIPTR